MNILVTIVIAPMRAIWFASHSPETFGYTLSRTFWLSEEKFFVLRDLRFSRQ
jgi:hypothetical protein